MIISHPHLLETKELERQHSPGARLRNIEARAQELVSVDGQRVVIAGCALSVPPGHDSESLAASFRSGITKRFLNRRPNATEATWHRFVKILRGQLANKTKIDEQTLPTIQFLIDGL